MTTEDLIEKLIYEGMQSYKRNSRGAINSTRLSRHEPVEIDGYTFTYWREYATYKAAEWIRECIPNSSIEIILDGNDSSIKIEMSDEEQKRLNCKLYNLLERFDKL